jgi:hypothetical protein
MVAIVK